jgi:hypothetical protein
MYTGEFILKVGAEDRIHARVNQKIRASALPTTSNTMMAVLLIDHKSKTPQVCIAFPFTQQGQHA